LTNSQKFNTPTKSFNKSKSKTVAKSAQKESTTGLPEAPTLEEWKKLMDRKMLAMVYEYTRTEQMRNNRSQTIDTTGTGHLQEQSQLVDWPSANFPDSDKGILGVMKA